MDFTIFRIFQTVDTIDPYQGLYEPRLVILSILVAIVASVVPLAITSRIAASPSVKGRWAWASAGAISMGGGIWSMHFIGMLAFSLPCVVTYDALGTLFSMVPGVFASGIALRIIGRIEVRRVGRILAGAVLFGGGIGAMHYAGMAAMIPDALVRYSALLVLVSVIVAVVLAFASLWVYAWVLEKQKSDIEAAVLAAPIMGLAVACMHYTAMRASIFYPLPESVVDAAALPVTALAILIAAGAGSVALITLIASVAGRQWELALSLAAEVKLREKLEAEANAGRARLQAIFDAVVDAIVTIDLGGRILQWSTGAQTIFGYRPDEIVGKNIARLLPASHSDQPGSHMTRFLEMRDPGSNGSERELTAIRKDGSEFPIELSISEVQDGKETFYTGILRDITDRKQAERELVRAREEAEAANLAKSKFLAVMSHEIRTPMNGVLGMANLLTGTGLNERQERLVGNVTRSGEALLDIINNVLDFAKIEAGKFELAAETFDLRAMIGDVMDMFGERCDAKGVELIYYIGAGLPPRIVGDPLRLRQVLINLVGNATKFTESGEIVVTVSVGDAVGDVIEVTFAVDDSGIGIASEDIGRLFESFHQVDSSLNRSRGGSGLGLAITRLLVEMMGGAIAVRSEIGRGSHFEFTIAFPFEQGAVAAPCGGLRADEPMRVLVADASPAGERILARYLERWGVAADVCDSLDAVEAAWCGAAQAGQPYRAPFST